MLDLRWPMGLMFTFVGALLAVWGEWGALGLYPFSAENRNYSLSINVNLWWGLVLLVFGLAMLGMAKLAANAEKSPDEKK